MAIELLCSATWEDITTIRGGYDMRKGYQMALDDVKKKDTFTAGFKPEDFDIFKNLDDEDEEDEEDTSTSSPDPAPKNDPFPGFKPLREIWLSDHLEDEGTSGVKDTQVEVKEGEFFLDVSVLDQPHDASSTVDPSANNIQPTVHHAGDTAPLDESFENINEQSRGAVEALGLRLKDA